MWYVIQAQTGKEQETADAIERVLGGNGYEECFVPRREAVWRIEGNYRIHIEPLFPSYVFVKTKTPEDFFLSLKKVPKLTRILGGDGGFWTIEPEEETILRNMMGENTDRVVRCSLVTVDENGDILTAEGVLSAYLDRVVKKRLRKRSVIVEVPFLGKTKRVQLGIRLKDDEMERP